MGGWVFGDSSSVERPASSVSGYRNGMAFRNVKKKGKRLFKG
jgi:hypothetical protein